MTKTEPKYRTRDIVTTKLRVVDDGPDFEGEVFCATLDGRHLFHIPASNILSIEPAPAGPLKVGDRARLRAAGGWAGLLVCISRNSEWALVERDDGPDCPALVPLSDLVRA